MTDRQPSPEWPAGPRQRIGPALRDLRARKGWSLAQLSRHSGISRSHLSRLEHGLNVPSYTTLRKLAEAFEVDLTYFTGYDETSRQIEEELASLLQRLNIPPSTWPEFAELSLEARGALIDALRRITTERDAAPQRERELEATILRQGVPDSVQRIHEGITQFGLSPIELAHALVQIEELQGERLTMVDRLPLATSDVLKNPGVLYHRVFGSDPPSIPLIRWWLNALVSSIGSSIRTYGARSIYSLPSIMREVRSSTWGPRLVIDRDTAHNRIQSILTGLRANPSYQIGLLDEAVPFNLLMKNQREVLILRYADSAESMESVSDTERRFGLRFSRPDVIAKFHDYYNEVWEQIPNERKDSEAVIAWFEARLAEMG